ncbi:GTPase domain-containing protein [Hippea sp. KM1]|uniref:GTPase domain-containing protein n=1 Tax=Hippea sp. KM1 TaxID=944481 RepID=UPI00046D944A|nr:GTPase domain-containing protein [Hippea sp. KM1]
MGWFGNTLEEWIEGLIDDIYFVLRELYKSIVNDPLKLLEYALFPFALSNEIEKLLKKESILIYGPSESGKTTLARFLATGEITYNAHEKTRIIEGYKPNKNVLKLKELNFRIKEFIDTPGTAYVDGDLSVSDKTYEALSSLKYDYLFYLFDVYKVYKNYKEYTQNIDGDMDFIEDKVKGKKVLLIGTHEDLLIKEIKDYNRKNLSYEVSKNPVIQRVLLTMGKNNLVSPPIIGSLKDKTNSEELVCRILNIMVKLKEN